MAGKGDKPRPIDGDKFRSGYDRIWANKLSDDVARCNGHGSSAEGWREGCENCLRRTAPRGERVLMMNPPSIVAFECEYLIENDKAMPRP